ncbi:MAG: YkgJ family cysteine cluster protein [Oligoflexia bacterium]|nr:YkgJ family cysteine cluster protein [Oligoflexia bacterium]
MFLCYSGPMNYHHYLKKIELWYPFKKEKCNSCMGLCCYLPLEVTLEELYKMEIISLEETDADFLSSTIKRLKAQGIVERYNRADEKFTLKRRASGACLFLGEDCRCKHYETRPKTCRNFPHVSPFNGRCPYQKI